MTAPQKHPADDVAAALARINGMLTMLSGVYDPQNASFVTGIPFVHETVQAMEILVARATDALTLMYQTCDLSIVRDIPAKPSAAAPVRDDARKPAFEAPKPVIVPPSMTASVGKTYEALLAELKPATAPFVAAAPAPAVIAPVPAPTPAPLQAAAEPVIVAAPPRAESFMNAFGPDEHPVKLSQRVEKSLAPLPTFVAPPPVPPLVETAPMVEKRAESYEELLRKITAVSAQAHAEGKAAAVDNALLPLVETIRQDLAKIRSVA